MKKNSGITLLELIVVIGLISIGLLSTTALLTQTLKTGGYNKEKIIATYLAQEGVELVRNIRDYNWLDPNSEGLTWDDGLENCTNCAVVYNNDANGNKSVLLDNVGDELFSIDNDGFYNYSPGNRVQFKRYIDIDNNTSASECMGQTECIQVTSRVTWDNDSSNIEITSFLFNWRS